MNISEFIRSKSTMSKPKINLSAVQTNIIDNNQKIGFRPSSSRMVSATMRRTTATKAKRATSSSAKQFPGKLHDMLAFAEANGLHHIVSWSNGGTAFSVHDSDSLLHLLPRFFSQTKFRSFERQLNMWSFERIYDRTNNSITYKHPYFIQGQKLLCRFLSRQSFQTPIVNQELGQSSSSNNNTRNNNNNNNNNKSLPSLSLLNNMPSSLNNDMEIMQSLVSIAMQPSAATNDNNSNNNNMMWSFPSSPSSSSCDSSITSSNGYSDCSSIGYSDEHVSPNSGPVLTNNNLDDMYELNILMDTIFDDSDLHDGDMTSFEGRQFFFVDTQ